MEKKHKLLSSIAAVFRRMFTKNLHIAILSFVFAVCIWGYVLYAENPIRTKVITDVSVSFEGEADLLARNLVVRGERGEILKDVTVYVETELSKYVDLDASNITATINLRTISMKGLYKNLPIRVQTTDGTIVRVTPASVDLEIDNLVKRKIPIEVVYAGEIPEGYWAGTPALSRSEIELSGPEADVLRVSKAVCTINLTDRTQSYNDSLQLTLLDEKGETIPASLFQGEIPAVSVRMDVLCRKTVPVVMDGAILGLDNLPANFEVLEKKISPETVDIVGSAAALDAIDSLAMVATDVSGATESILQNVELIVPEDVDVLNGATVSLYVNIREKENVVNYTAVPILAENLGSGLNVTLDVHESNVSLKGKISVISALRRENVKLAVDLRDMKPGKYTVPVELQIVGKDVLKDLSYTLSVKEITVTIR